MGIIPAAPDRVTAAAIGRLNAASVSGEAATSRAPLACIAWR